MHQKISASLTTSILILPLFILSLNNLYADQTPVIASVSPSAVSIGETVTISGSGFGVFSGNLNYNPQADFNADNVVNQSDTDMLMAVWPSQAGDGRYDSAFDLNQDGQINQVDVEMLAPTWLAGRGSQYVRWTDGKTARIISWSDTQIVCKTPVGAETGEVIVVTVQGSSNAVSVTVN